MNKKYDRRKFTKSQTMQRSKPKIKFAFVALLFKFSWGDIISDYETIINNGIQDASNYQLPTDNEQYRPQNSELIKEIGNWDFIIVGAGAGGAVLANRLSEIKKWKILLIEAGGPETNFSTIPAMQLFLHLSRFNWGYYTTPQKYACLGMQENRCPIVKGKALGGTTAVNFGVYSRANKEDYNLWEAQGNPGWSYDEILPYFIKSENKDTEFYGDPGYHGRGGYWHVKHARPISKQFEKFIEGSRIVRNFTSKDYNGRDEIGVFQMQLNNDRQFRDSTNNAFLRPVSSRCNLKILTEAYVTKVILSHGERKVRGVQFSRNGRQYIARARNEVILSAGAINTPHILMLSGIGPSDHLKEMNIPVVSNLPVGKTLYDHGIFYSAYIGTNFTEPDPGDLRHQIADFVNDYGTLTVPAHSQGLGFLQTKYATDPHYPDLEIAVTLTLTNINSSLGTHLIRNLRTTNETYLAITQSLRGYQTVMNAITIDLKSQSIGSVTLQSNDPYKFPLIDANVLADKHDIEVIYQGILIIKRILNTEPMKKINATLIEIDYPQCRSYALGSKDYWYCAFRLMSASSYHQCGSCRMGPNPKTSVVNHRGIVHGYDNLRIVDASIYPTLVAGHPAAPTVMIAERIADFIKLEN